VFCGVGGGTTQGIRTTQLAWDAEAEGAMGVVVNAPMGNLDIERIYKYSDIPLVVTVLNEHTDIQARLDAGASILNVSAASRTPEVVSRIREKFPDVPIIATGGPTPESISATVEAGANAISYTPPTTKELFSRRACMSVCSLSTVTTRGMSMYLQMRSMSRLPIGASRRRPWRPRPRRPQASWVVRMPWVVPRPRRRTRAGTNSAVSRPRSSAAA